MAPPGGRPADVLNAFARTAGIAMDAAGQLAQRRRNTMFVQATTQARRELNQFEMGLRDDTEWESYGEKFAQRSEEIVNGIGGNLNDPLVQEQFLNWASREAESSRQRVSQLAWRREQSQGLVTLNDGIAASREMTDYDTRQEHADLVIEAAFQSGYIDETQAEQMRREEYGAILMDQYTGLMQETYVEGGYDAAANWLNGEDALNDRQKQSLFTALNRMDAQAQRRLEQLQAQQKNVLYEGIYTGETTIRSILSSDLDANDQDWLINRMDEFASQQREIGEGSTTERGRMMLDSLRTRLDGGEDPIPVIEDGREAYLKGDISDTDFRRIRDYQPLPEFAEYWEQIEEAAIENGMDPVETVSEARQRLGRVLLVEDQEGRLYRDQNIGRDQIAQYVQSTLREIAGEELIKREIERSDYGFDREGGRQSRRFNSAEEALVQIQSGALIGRVDQYSETLNQMLAEHRRMLDTPEMRRHIVLRMDEAPPEILRDGRMDGLPVFVADTPVGRQQIALMSRDPNTGEDLFDETPFYWNSNAQRWEILPMSGSPMHRGAPADRGRVMLEGEWTSANDLPTMAERARRAQEEEEEYLNDDSIFGPRPENTRSPYRPRLDTSGGFSIPGGSR